MLVHDLAKWVAQFDAAAIPAEVIEKTKAHVLDSLGCAFGALEEPAPMGTLRAVRAMGGTPECTIIGTPDRTSLTNAVLINGLLVRDLDLNDMGFGGGAGAGHPSNNIPVALAAGERMDRSGRDVLAAIVLGYEIARRLPSADDGWDSTTGATLVGAVMAGWLMSVPEDQLAEAFALSLAHCNILSIVRRGQLSAAKSLSGAIAAQTAVTSVLLAAEGVTGPPTALEESARAIRSGADQAGLTAPLGGDYGIMEVGLKAHPCIGTMQTAVEAALRVRSRLKEPPGEIERVEVRMADTPFVSRQVADTERQNPSTRETADHSFPFLAAVALLDGELTVHSFENERWNDPAVRALMQRTTLETDPSLNKYLPGAWPASVRVITKVGGDYSEEVPHHPGHTKNFMTPDQVQAKFHRFSAEAIPEDQRAAIIAEVTGLERAPSIRTLMKLVGRDFMTDVNMVMVGDIYVGRPDPDAAFAPALPLLKDADIAFCNLETVIADAKYLSRHDKDPHPRTDESALDSYMKAGFNVMNLANNPSTWHGLDPFLRCLDVLDKAGVVQGGGGRNLAEARKPAIIERKGTRVAFVCRASVCDPQYAASEEQGGIAFYPVSTYYEPRLRVHHVPGSPPYIRTIPDRGEHRDALVEDIKKAREQADVVIVSWHWGVSPATGGSGELVDYQTEMGHFAIDAGADMVAGHHPHVLQPIEVYKGKPILYSLGNFVHDMHYGRGHARLMTTLVRVLIRDGKIARLAFVPGMYIGNGPPEFSTPDQAPEIVEHMKMMSAPFKTQFRVDKEDVEVVLA